MKHLLRLLAPVALLASAVIPATAQAAVPQPPAILEWKSSNAGWQDSYYWYDANGNRYAFTSTASYQSWFPGNPTGVSQANIAELSPIPLKGAVYHKPAARLIKFQSSPAVYAVGRFGLLRWIATEQVALELYGEGWTSYVDELPVTDYPLYHLASPITDSAEFDRDQYAYQTNPSTNVVNASNRPPEKFDATMTLSTNRSMVTVGQKFTLSASVNTRDMWNTVTIRFYDHQNQVAGVCRGTVACSVTVTAGGPVGTQSYYARAFNQYDQAVEAKTVTVQVANPQ